MSLITISDGCPDLLLTYWCDLLLLENIVRRLAIIGEWLWPERRNGLVLDFLSEVLNGRV
jgi:hypothetical protein